MCPSSEIGQQTLWEVGIEITNIHGYLRDHPQCLHGLNYAEHDLVYPEMTFHHSGLFHLPCLFHHQTHPQCTAVHSYKMHNNSHNVWIIHQSWSWKEKVTCSQSCIYEIAQKNPQQEFEGNCCVCSIQTKTNTTRVSAVITLWVSLTMHQTVSFIMKNGSDQLPLLPTHFIGLQQ